MKEAFPNEPASITSTYNRFSGQHCTIGSLVFSLTGAADRIVVDRTGLTGNYDMDLSWSPDNEPGSAPSLFTAVQEQLGLKLEPAKAAVDVVVVDHLERPAES